MSAMPDASSPLFPGPEIKPRDGLPNLEKVKKPGVLTILAKEGRALPSFINKGIFPIAGQEPLTELQRKAEMFEFSAILEKAADAPIASNQRLLLVTAFNIFGWTGACQRTEYKAMRPMDYETFDYVSAELGFSFLIEFVKLYEDDRYSSTCQAYGRGWSMSGESCIAIKFATTGLEYNGNYAAELTFDDGDTYVLSMPLGYASGLTTGHPVFTYGGKATVEHRSSGRSTDVDLTEPGMLSSGKKHRVKGHLVKGGNKVEDLKITGTWDDRINIVRQDGQEETLWTFKHSGPPTKNQYNMPFLAVQLNQTNNALTKILPPTDSRKRADLQALEKGFIDEAEEERKKLLALRDERRAAGLGKPRWFSLRAEPLKAGPEGKLMKYQYDGGYWETRAQAAKIGKGAWTDCDDIFGLHGR